MGSEMCIRDSLSSERSTACARDLDLRVSAGPPHESHGGQSATADEIERAVDLDAICGLGFDRLQTDLCQGGGTALGRANLTLPRAPAVHSCSQPCAAPKQCTRSCKFAVALAPPLGACVSSRQALV